MSLPEYHDDRDSRTFLKLMLTKLGQNKLPPNLVNINLFYEYVSLVNTELKNDIDDELRKGNRITKETAIGLYEKHVWDKERKRNAEINNALYNYLTGLSEGIKKIKTHNKDSHKIIQEQCKKLETIRLPSGIEKLITELLSETQKIIETNSKFEDELSHTQEELEEIKKELDEAKEQVDTDSMTKLKNKKFFETTIGNEMYLSRNKPVSLSLIYLDIDHFKNVNDTYGHLIGDKVICFVADTIKNIVGEDGFAARIGGEEFAILLPETPLVLAEKIGESIRKKVEKAKLKVARAKNGEEEKVIRLTISVGITKYKNQEKLTNLLKRADEALYESKDTGRNKVTIFH